MSLPSYYVARNRKDLAEQAIVSKRERDASRKEMCHAADTYHKQLSYISSKYKNIEDGQCLRTPRLNEESRVGEMLLADKKDRLEMRRQRLSHILAVENEQYMKELADLRKKESVQDPYNISKIKSQIDELQRSRREAELEMQRKYNQHFSSSSSFPRQPSDDKLQKEVSEAWQRRKDEMEKLSQQRHQNEQQRLKHLELEQLEAVREAQLTEVQLLEQREEWARLMQGKMSQLHRLESEIKQVVSEKQALKEQQEKLSSLREKRNSFRDLQKQAFQKMKSAWQPKERLQRMSAENLHSLDLDNKILDALSELNNHIGEPSSKACLAAETKAKVQSLIADEKERALEIQQLYHEEAQKNWESKLQIWVQEYNSRDENFKSVFKSLEEDIEEKIARKSTQENDLTRVREECAEEIGEINNKAGGNVKVLSDQQAFYLEHAKKLNEELDSKCGSENAEESSKKTSTLHHPLGFF